MSLNGKMNDLVVQMAKTEFQCDLAWQKLAKMEFQWERHRLSATADEHREEFVGPKKLGLEVVAVVLDLWVNEDLKELGLDDVLGLDNVHGLEVVVVQKHTRQDDKKKYFTCPHFSCCQPISPDAVPCI